VTALSILQDWEDRYSAEHVSQDTFFAPRELLASDRSSSPRNDAVDESDIPASTSVPQIVISGPEANHSLSLPPEKPILNKAPPLDRAARFLDDTSTRPKLRERRHSVISFVAETQHDEKSKAPRILSKQIPATSTPRPWTFAESFPKNGWRMRARCSTFSATDSVVDIVVVYLYNSALFQKPQDHDADLNLFCYTSPIETSKVEFVPIQTKQRATTDLGKQRSHQMSSDKFAEHDWAGLQTPRGQQVNWLQDHDMLRKHVPGCRIMTIGFDIAPTLSAVPNFHTAAGQLREYLLQQRENSQQKPVIFFGHTFGGMFVIHMLSSSPKTTNSSEPILSNTAGLFLFSCSSAYSISRSQLLADLYGAKASDRVFSDLSGTPMFQQLSKAARAGLYSQHPRQQGFVGSTSSRTKTHQTTSSIAIGFPIFQLFARGESRETKASLVDSISNFLGAPVRTVLLEKDMVNALRFSTSQDPDFLRMLMLVRSSLQTHQLLQAVTAGNKERVLDMIQDGFNVNLRDRWSQTALQIAVRTNDQVMVHVLLRADGIDANVRDKSSNTPLHYAIRSGNETIIRTLLHHGADIGLENSRKRTPRDLAEKHKSRKHIAKLLKSRLVSGPDQSLSSKRIGSGTLLASKEGQLACKSFQITVTEIFASDSSDKHWSVNVSVEALLYDSASLDEILRQVRPREVKSEIPVCVWIHVPENNMIWLEDLFRKVGIHQAIWQDTRRSVSHALRNRAITPHIGMGNIRSLFLPYLSYELNARQQKRTEYVHAVDEAFRQQSATDSVLSGHTDVRRPRTSREESRERPQLLQIPTGKNLESYPYRDEDSDSDFSETMEDDDPDDLEDEEKALIKNYLHNPSALHVRRTLDQYFYHMLESTQERDIDQVVSRWSENVRSEARHNILMVDQLWLWTACRGDDIQYDEKSRQDGGNKDEKTAVERPKNNYVISCFPSRTGAGYSPHRTLDDLRLLVLDPYHGKRDPIREPEHLISRILETCCSVFDRLQDSEVLRFFQMFEDSIGSIDDKESRLFRAFQRGSTQLLELDSANKFYNKQKNGLMADLLDIREEIKLLVEVKDIRDEINIILSVLTMQVGLVKQMTTPTGSKPALLRTPVIENMIQTDIYDFKKLDDQAKTTQDKLNTLMDLKQKAANAWEAREARETAVATGKQGSTLMVFTMVTIIFLPLSFMSSFFAIGIAAFPRDTASGEVNWPLGTVMGILFGVSLAVSTPLIIFALNMDYCSSVYKELRNNYLTLAGIKLIDFLPPLGWCNRLGVQWSEILQKTRADYIKNEAEVSLLNARAESAAFSKNTEPGALFPSTVSSHTLMDDDIEMLRPPRSRWRAPKFGMRLRMTDIDLPSDDT
jgi:Mg2+ and Co2+ transporter CorA